MNHSSPVTLLLGILILPIILFGQSSNTIKLVKNINHSQEFNSHIKMPVQVGSRLFFAANDNVHGPEIWITDGTKSGTYLVKDAIKESAYSGPTGLTRLGDRVIFFTHETYVGYTLWITDGTEVGTGRLKQLTNRLDHTHPPEILTSSSDMVYIRIDHMAGGYELWKTDGTEEGTLQLRYFEQATPLSLGHTRFYHNELYFAAETPDHGSELWKTDGTQIGTIMLKDLISGKDDGAPFNFQALNDVLYFMANTSEGRQALWKTDGSEAGTQQVSINTFQSVEEGFSLAYKNRLLFVAKEEQFGSELWISDGTDSGTHILKDINPGLVDALPRWFAIADEVLYFSAIDKEYGDELWKSDGTSENTMLVKDIYPDSTGSSIVEIQTFGDKVVFQARTQLGSELWISDGTEAGTHLIKDINEGEADASPNTFIVA